MKILPIAICLIFSIRCTFSQSPTDNNISLSNYKSATTVVPPSPNAASLAKYAEIPVDAHTGIPAISVPLFQWKENEMEENISISYHAGGIKVEDVAANVGTGWSLNAGGVVTRSIRGLADDDVRGFINTPEIYNYNTSLFTGNYYLPPVSVNTEMQIMNVSPLNIIAYFNDPNPDDLVLRNLYVGLTDNQQDLFCYNVGGIAGKFVLNKNGNVVKLDQNDLIIEVFYYNLSSGVKQINFFTITNDRGLKYTFDIKEESVTSRQINTDAYPYAEFTTSTATNSFYLSSYVNLNTGDSVKYFYNSRTISYSGGWSEELTYHANNDPKPGGGKAGTRAGYNISQSNNIINAKQLSYIDFPKGTKVMLHFTEPRSDLSGDSILSGIEMMDITGSSRKIKFNHSYFDASNTVNNPEVETWNVMAASDFQYKRLKLDNLKEVVNWADVQGQLISAFQYSNITLPPRSSKAVDYWGYYYGPNRYAYTLIPQIQPATWDQLTVEGLIATSQEGAMINDYYMGADRTPDKDFAQAGVLKKIILPTGGGTEFTYETNSVKDHVYFNSNTKTTQDYQTNQLQLTQHTNISFEPRNRPEVVFYITFKRVNQDGSTYVPPVNNGSYTCLEGMVEMTQIKFYVKSTDGTINKECSFSAVESGTGNAKVYFSLPTDKEYYFYYTHEFIPNECLNNVYFAFSLVGKYSIDNVNNLVGGLRVFSIIHSDNLTGIVLKRIYDYNGDDGFVSGQIPVVPNYSSSISAVQRWIIQEGAIPIALGHAQFTSRTSNSCQTLGYTAGNVGYKRVSFKDVSSTGASNGKTISYFSDMDVRGLSDVFPYPPLQVLNWSSGNLTKEEVFNANGNMQKRTEYFYSPISQELNSGENRSVLINCIRTDETAELNPISFCRYVAHSYYPYTGDLQLNRKVFITFEGNGTSMSDTYDYTYHMGTKNFQTISNKNSIGEVKVTKFYYPADYSNAIFSSMINRKMGGIKLAQRTFKYSDILSGQFKEIAGLGVDYAQLSSGAHMPKYYSSLEVTDPLSNPSFDFTKVQQPHDGILKTILSYDQLRNIKEEYIRTGPTVSYLWSYHSTKPVVKVVGASYNDVISKLSSISESSFQNLTDELAIKNASNEIRQAYSLNPSVQVFSYTYKPFAGISSDTDPNGKVTFYEYDAFNRLALIRDTNGHILKKYCYSYFGEIENCGGAVDPNACNESNCNGQDKKCINGICETGQMKTVSCTRLNPNSWQRVYYYQWSDDSASQQYSITTSSSCLDLEL